MLCRIGVSFQEARDIRLQMVVNRSECSCQ